MLPSEFSDLFDVLYNNITSNQAPGLTEYEKSLFLTKAQNEIIKNYFTANSKGNNIGQGFDDSAKRQADFSVLMKTDEKSAVSDSSLKKIDDRSFIYEFPTDVFIMINEALLYTNGNVKKRYLVIPLRYDDYTLNMSKPFKRPLKNQAWRLINSASIASNAYKRSVEIITGPEYTTADNLKYEIRYIKRPKPIIVGNIDDLTINGYKYKANSPGAGETDGTCELDPILHEDILQRAIELAKIAWTSTGNDNAQMVIQAGQRSE